ncbi:MAG: Mg-chelatase subunit ChlD [Bacteroidetes bacterium]|jgi:Ca-activated chloride channel family protein|nr:Mg-chelatase subunit ChlD [Bacteroidota bacterium]
MLKKQNTRRPVQLIFAVLLVVLVSRFHAQVKYQGQVKVNDTKDFTKGKKYDPDATTRILFIFDDSYSMYGNWNSGVKMEIAQKLMGEFLDSLKKTPKLEIALRCYGHQTPFRPTRNCEDSKLEVPFAPVATNAKVVKDRINKLAPTGTTPIAYSLEQCAADFPEKENCRNIVILITDGIEECNGDPCAVSRALQSKGIFLRPFVIGVGLDVKFADVFGCMGKFYDVSNEANFKNVMKLVMIEALSQTTVQVNLNNTAKKPLETDVTMTFYDQKTGQIKYDYVHTLNHRGNPDTLILDPEITYKMVVHTIPELTKENITLEKGIHNMIPLDAPQGFLKIDIQGTNPFKNFNYIVRKKNTMNTLNVQEIGKTEKYITGLYDIEVLTLPRIKMQDVEIKQSSTNTLKIPASGQVLINKGAEGFGSIYLEEGKKLTWVCNLKSESVNEIVYLLPGNYRAEYRLKTQQESEKTAEKKFTVVSEQNVSIKFY